MLDLPIFLQIILQAFYFAYLMPFYALLDASTYIRHGFFRTFSTPAARALRDLFRLYIHFARFGAFSTKTRKTYIDNARERIYIVITERETNR